MQAVALKDQIANTMVEAFFKRGVYIHGTLRIFKVLMSMER